MEALVLTNSKGQDVTTSLKVAEVFGKRHDHVLRDIQNLSCSEAFRLTNFGETPYVHPQNGQTYSIYEMTKDGFSFLVMGYTGEKAAKFKELFIAEFNKRDALLRDDDYILNRAMSIMQKRMETLELENSRKEEQLALQAAQIQEAAPKVEYFDEVLQSKSLIAANIIAKELGTSAVTLNRILKDMGIIYLSGKTWLLYHQYQNKGYTGTKTTTYRDSYGNEKTAVHTYWTEKGREFVHQKVKQRLVNTNRRLYKIMNK